MGSASDIAEPEVSTASRQRYDDLFSPRAVLVWRTATKRRFPAIVYSLIGCPPVGSAVYLLVAKTGSNARSVLAIGRTSSDVPSVNLAEIRREGARLGANEVHLNVIGETDSERALIERELKNGLLIQQSR